MRSQHTSSYLVTESATSPLTEFMGAELLWGTSHSC